MLSQKKKKKWKNMFVDQLKLVQSRCFTMRTSHQEEITSTLKSNAQNTEIIMLFFRSNMLIMRVLPLE